MTISKNRMGMIDDGIVWVGNVGVSGAVSGQWMVCETVAANLTGATEIYASDTGCKQAFLLPVGFTNGTTWIVAAWDTVNDATAVKAVLANVITTGPAGTADGSANTNTAAMTLESQRMITIGPAPDGARIKQIAAIGNAATKYYLITIS